VKDDFDFDSLHRGLADRFNALSRVFADLGSQGADGSVSWSTE
jgi:hypothetical protein